MKFCDNVIQNHLLNGGKIKRRLGSCNIIAHIGENGFIFDNCGSFYAFCENDLKANDWEIADGYYEDLIANRNLCFFWNESTDNFNIGYLIKIKNDNSYHFGAEILRNGYTVPNFFKNCKPLNAKDYNIMNKE